MMNKVFIGGSRRITRLNTKAAQTMDNLVEKGLTVLIGDANGADKAVHEKAELRCTRKLEHNT